MTDEADAPNHGWLDNLTREQAIDLLREALDGMAKLDAGLLDGQAEAADGVHVEPVAEPVPKVLDCGEARIGGRALDAVVHVIANDQARRAVLSLQYRVLHRADALGVLGKSGVKGSGR